MVDEVANSTPATAASSAAPIVEVAVPTISTEVAPVLAPVTEPTPAVPEPTPAVEIIPVEPEKTEPAVENVKPDTLLGGDKKTEEKPVEIKTEEKPTEVKEGEPSSLPSYEEFKLPEGVTFESEKMGEFTKALAEFENTTKSSHEEVQKFGQSLVDRHIAEVQNTLERYTKTLTDAWNKQKIDWKDSFLKDPEFINRTDTAVNSAIDAIGVYGGSAEQQAEFRGLMESTGIGNHPAMIRLLSNVMTAKAEPKPLAAPQIASGEKVSKVQKMYGKKTG